MIPPDKMYLNVDTIYTLRAVSWCAAKQNEIDVEYIRADLAKRLATKVLAGNWVKPIPDKEAVLYFEMMRLARQVIATVEIRVNLC